MIYFSYLRKVTCCPSSSVRTPEPKFICSFNFPSTISNSIKSETPGITVVGKGPLYKRVPTGLCVLNIRDKWVFPQAGSPWCHDHP